MNPPPDHPPTPLTEPQRLALLKLLDDEDGQVADAVRQRLLDEGPGLASWLRHHALSDQPVIRRRAREVLHHFAATEAHERMLAFCRRGGSDPDLEDGAFRLAQSQYPEINTDGYGAILDDWARQVEEWLPASRTDVDGVLAGLHVVLFQQLGLRGNEDDYYHPDNSYLNRVIDRRTGNPISLCTIVVLIGRRLGLPFSGVGLPAHFLCRYQAATREIYVDAFHGGRLLSRTDCIAFVNQLGRPFEPAFLQPISSRRMLQRMCGNLEHAYHELRMQPELARIRQYHQLLGTS